MNKFKIDFKWQSVVKLGINNILEFVLEKIPLIYLMSYIKKEITSENNLSFMGKLFSVIKKSDENLEFISKLNDKINSSMFSSDLMILKNSVRSCEVILNEAQESSNHLEWFSKPDNNNQQKIKSFVSNGSIDIVFNLKTIPTEMFNLANELIDILLIPHQSHSPNARIYSSFLLIFFQVLNQIEDLNEERYHFVFNKIKQFLIKSVPTTDDKILEKQFAFFSNNNNPFIKGDVNYFSNKSIALFDVFEKQMYKEPNQQVLMNKVLINKDLKYNSRLINYMLDEMVKIATDKQNVSKTLSFSTILFDIDGQYHAVLNDSILENLENSNEEKINQVLYYIASKDYSNFSDFNRIWSFLNKSSDLRVLKQILDNCKTLKSNNISFRDAQSIIGEYQKIVNITQNKIVFLRDTQFNLINFY